MTDVEIVRETAESMRPEKPDDVAALTRAADALAREPALMRVVEAAREALAAARERGIVVPKWTHLNAALRALDEVGR